ncbi:Crp/Fnr family transcriptional regulator [Acuticoccus mangrovi]|uniref:Helix-turn-helix domain-containing protein n=1 Tax=Acuticoccus mangrovi TaxID=2796142 RepID=A0A934IMK0_9HYPH|nr:helix-turn-helix domain-containing protein [Acuticoccus mangrovi]MBJ3776597.1 helix-turn-helix domain-containing protein [Acuticoccus mangrovi]
MFATSVASPALPEALWPVPASTLRWDSQEHLFHEGDPVSAIFTIESGAVVIYRTARDGCRQIHGIRFQGELVGIGYNVTYGVSAVAVRPTSARAVSRATLDRLLDNDPTLARQMMRALTSELRRTSNLLMVIGSRTAIGRVAACLIDFSNRAADSDDTFVLPLSRGEMGDLLGLTIETVSRAMTRLKVLGIIALRRTDTVTIRKRATLLALAEEDGDGAARGRLCACSEARCTRYPPNEMTTTENRRPPVH